MSDPSHCQVIVLETCQLARHALSVNVVLHVYICFYYNALHTVGHLKEVIRKLSRNRDARDLLLSSGTGLVVVCIALQFTEMPKFCNVFLHNWYK